jgi:hypothetical protein
MTLEDAQNRSDLLHLGTSIKKCLEPLSRMQIDESGCAGIVEGRLNLSHDEVKTSIAARCSFRFGADWITRLPVVSTSEPWLIRGGAEWHIFSDGNICYVYGPHWRDEVAAVLVEFDIEAAAAFAAAWCVRSTQWLLYRHHFAFEHGLKKWPIEWPFWPHDYKARLEYEKLKRGCEKLNREKHHECVN